MPWQVWAILCVAACFVGLLAYVRHGGKLIQESHDEVSSLEAEAEVKEKSGAIREAAAAARDAGGGVYGDDRLSTVPLAPGDYRD